MTVFNFFWFVIGIICGYVSTLLIILIMTVPARPATNGRLPYEQPGLDLELQWLSRGEAVYELHRYRHFLGARAGMSVDGAHMLYDVCLTLGLTDAECRHVVGPAYWMVCVRTEDDDE